MDEFSRFARMPAPAPRPTDVRAIVEGVVTLYRDAHPALSITSRHGGDVPVLEVDPDQVKRAVINLVDNAVAAVNGVGDVAVETSLLEGGQRVRIAISDGGPVLGSHAGNPRSLEGRTARVRGWIAQRGGAPVIDLSAAGGIEVLGQ